MARKTIILYQGASLINGEPIVALAQSESNNSKTGNMIQTFILDATTDPITASRTGLDESVCGSCVHKGTPNNNDKGQATNRTCYVTLAHAPLGKYKAYKKGVYGTTTATLKEIESFGSLQGVRLGSFGDPCAVPNDIWKALTSKALYSTAYTHAAINPMPESIMTSTDNLKQSVDAWSRNERTFRVISSIDQLYKRREILCPASEESAAIRNAPRSTCSACKLCSGNKISAKSIAIVAHGTSKRKAKEIVQ